MNARNKEVKEFLAKHFSQSAIELLDGIEVVTSVQLSAEMAAVFTTLNSVDDFDPQGRPVIAFNTKAEVYGFDKDLLQPGIMDGIIVHEREHYRQFADGRLSFRLDSTAETQTIVWEGKGIILSKELTIGDYFELPWEKEAFAAQSQYMADTTGIDAEEWLTQFMMSTLSAYE